MYHEKNDRQRGELSSELLKQEDHLIFCIEDVGIGEEKTRSKLENTDANMEAHEEINSSDWLRQTDPVSREIKTPPIPIPELLPRVHSLPLLWQASTQKAHDCIVGKAPEIENEQQALLKHFCNRV